MAGIEYGFALDRETFKISILDSKKESFLSSKESVIKTVFNLIQNGLISHKIKENILNEVLPELEFPELVSYFEPMPLIQKVSFMVDLNMDKLLNPTINMMETGLGQMARACIFEENKKRGINKIFPFFRFKDEGINLIAYLHAIEKISHDDLMVMKAQISRLSLPLSYFNAYSYTDEIKTLNPAPAP